MAAETGPRHPADRKLGVIILGASTYPHFPPTRLDNESFARSAAAFRSLIADEGASVFGKPAILDLFNVEDDPTSVIRRVKAFLKSEPGPTDVLFYYCGHGDFLPDRTYYLTLKVTEPENEAFTGLPLRQMRLALETQLMMKRVFLVLDCCFSGQAAKEWMAAGIGHVIEEQIFQSFPKRGTALIAASARGGPALAPGGESLTMFTGALISTISSGLEGDKRESFRDIVDAVRARISDRYGSAAVVPEIHAPRQEEGDITFTPFFVNRAFAPPPETKAEREMFELAVADLDRLLPRTREAAVETLAELLSSTQSAAFRVEILNKLRTVQQEDDSQRIRTRCAEILARWPEHSDEGSGEEADRSEKLVARTEFSVVDQSAPPIGLQASLEQNRNKDVGAEGSGSGDYKKTKSLSTAVVVLVGTVLVLGGVSIAFLYLSPFKPVPHPVPDVVNPDQKREQVVAPLPVRQRLSLARARLAK